MKKKDRRHSVATGAVPATALPVWLVPFGIALLAWAAVVVLSFDRKFPASLESFFIYLDGFAITRWGDFFAALLRYIKATSLMILLNVAVLGWGSRLIPTVGDGIEHLERALLSVGAGFALLSMLIVLLGFAGFVDTRSLWIFFVLFCVGGVLIGRTFLRECVQSLRSVSFGAFFLSPLNWLLVVFMAIAASMAFIPELFYDALVYHVGLPQMYVNEGRIVDTPNVYFSRFPMFLHMLYVLGVGLDGATMAKLFNTTLMFVSVGTFWMIAKRLDWSRSAVWAPLIVLSMPVFQYNVWSTAVDAGMSCYTILAFLAFLIWRQQTGAAWPWFILFSVFVGAVFGIKYTGVLMAMAYGGMLFLTKRKEDAWRPFVQRLFVFGFVITLMMAPWLIRNAMWTGNPVYPLLPTYFESRHISLPNIQSEEGAVKRSAPKSLIEYATFPWTQTMRELSNFNFIGPLVLVILPILVLVGMTWRRSRHVVALVFLTGLYFVIALRFSGDIRYLMPGFFLLSALLAGGVSLLTEKSRWLGWIVQAGFACAVLYNLTWVVQYANGLYQPGPILTGQLPTSTVVSTIHGGLNMCPWNSMQSDLEKMPASTRVYILGNEQVFGFPKRFWYSSVHDHNPLVLWANASSSPEELYQKLVDQKFTHILFNAPEAVRLKGYSLFEWTGRGRDVFGQFGDRYLQLVNVKPVDQYPNALFLFEIKKDPAPPPFQFRRYFKTVMNL